ncbi:MAG TPA: pentapeptide repeat-containing protein [Herpetosiphonaceae bacterium]
MQSKRRRVYPGIQSPQLPARLPSETLSVERLADQATFAQRTLTGGDLSDQSAADALFEQVHLKRVSLARTHLTTLQMLDARCEVCDLAGAEWEKAHLSRIEWLGCRLTGLKLMESEIADAVIVDCNAEFMLCWSSVFKAVRFERCNLHATSFHGADLSGVVFKDCDLSQADLQGAKLVGADLRGSTVDGLKVGVKEMQGAIIDPTQAALVASLLGITVRWEE